MDPIQNRIFGNKLTMKDIKIIWITVGFLFAWNYASGQQSAKLISPSFQPERITVHFSHESAFTGEICWFKVYCTSPLVSGRELSDLAFIELVGNDNSSLIRKKILLTNGQGMGEFEIPVSLPTGLYYILAYTSWMKNFGESSFFKKELAIINPAQPFHNEQDITFAPQEADFIHFNCNKTEIIADKRKYSRREEVSLKIKKGLSGKEFSGDFSVSVYRKEPAMIFDLTDDEKPVINHDLETITYKPDFNGICLDGKLADQDGNAVPGARITLSMPGAGTDINSYSTDTLGYFHFKLKKKEGEQDIVMKVPDAGLKIDLRESFWNGFRNHPDNKSFFLNSVAVDYLKEKYAYFQLQGKFKKQDYIKILPVPYPADSSVFYSKPFQTIEMKNYISLDSLREYFYELVPSVKFTQRRGEADISVIDQQTLTHIEEKPGVFLDGVKYDNYAIIAGIPAEEIDRMSILPTVYYYKDFTFGGIIDIHTKKSDFNGVKLLPGMIRFRYPLANACEWKFISPDYDVAGSPGRIPDFRYLLHWDPNVRPDSSGEASVRFYTGDLKGIYIVSVMGRSKEGEFLEAETEINVEDF